MQAVFTQGEQVSVTLLYPSGDFNEIKAFFESWADGLGDPDQSKFETSNPPSIGIMVSEGNMAYNVSASDVAGSGVQVTAFAGPG